MQILGLQMVFGFDSMSFLRRKALPESSKQKTTGSEKSGLTS
jgi:hypothetical protein